MGLTPTNFEECIKLPDSKIQKSYPAICVTRYGKRFVQELTEEEKEKLKPPNGIENLSRDFSLRDWKTYTNLKHGYRFDAPQHARILETISDGYKEATTGSDLVSIWDLPLYSRYKLHLTPPSEYANSDDFNSRYTPGKPYKNLDDFVKTVRNIQGDRITAKNIPYDIFSHTNYRVIEYRQLNIGGKSSIRLYAEPLPDEGAALEMSLDELFIEVSPQQIMRIEGFPPYYSKNNPIRDQILSTFQFTE